MICFRHAGNWALTALLIIATSTAVNAQTADTVLYPIVIQFQSECCGVPDDASLRTVIKSFRKKHKVGAISAIRIGPMGREGEYWLAFPLKELTDKQAAIFSNQLKNATSKLKDPGSATFVEQMMIEKSTLPERATAEKVSF